MSWIRAHTAEITIGALALALGAAIFLYAHKDMGSLEQSKQRGATIVAALEQHRAQRGEYPATLDELVPRLLPAIEPPTWGLRRWRYRRYTTAAADTAVYFQLSVAANEAGHPVLYFDVTSGRWVLNN